MAQYRNITAHNEFKLADIVFIGKVIEIKKTEPDKNTGRYFETILFKVTKSWKQDLPAIFTIKNEIYGCITDFSKKEDWLIYSYKKQNGEYSTMCCCSRTKPLAGAVKDLREFEAKKEKPTKIIEISTSPK